MNVGLNLFSERGSRRRPELRWDVHSWDINQLNVLPQALVIIINVVRHNVSNIEIFLGKNVEPNRQLCTISQHVF